MGTHVNPNFVPMSFKEIVASRRQEHDTKAKAYGDLYTGYQELMKSTNPEHVKAVAAENAELDRLNTRRTRSPEEQKAIADSLHTKGVPAGQVAHNPTLTDLSIQYANEAYIGRELMPVVDVPTKGAKYFLYPQDERHAYPDDRIGSNGVAREISETRTEANIAAVTYGLTNRVDSETLSEETAPLDELMDMTQAINEGLAFKEERRIATIMQDAANYATANKITVAGGSKWDATGGGNPVGQIKEIISGLWTGRGQSSLVGWCGRDVFDVLCQHPGILELFKYAGTPGLATPEMIARMLGMDQLLVGSAREDTANEGQNTPAYGRMWSNNFGVARVARTTSIRNASFGYTFRVKGDPVTSEWYDPKLGKGGSFHAKVAFDADYKIVAADTGGLIIGPLV